MDNFKKLIKEAYLGNPLNEATDFNDPALIKARAAQMKRDKIEADEKAKQAALNKKYGSSFMDKLEAEIDLKNELADLEDEREDVLRNMEQEAEPEGGPIADDYGSILNDMDARMAAIKSELDDLRMYESVNENEDSYVKVSQPRFVKDKNNPNFLFIRMDYDTGPGVSIALGKETMAGQIRRLSSQEAMRRAKEIARNLEQMFDVEDIDIVDKENGTVEIFAVSDDFENMDPKSKFSWNGYKYGLKSLNEELLKEFTVPGGDYRNSYANRLPEEQLTSTDDYELFSEMFPRGEASRILMDPNRKKLFDQHLEWTKDTQYNNVFQHMQYHEVEYEGELYKVHQTQYYNTNYDDFRNPRFTELMISKDGKRMGTYLVDTTEYIKDLKNLDVKKRVSESLNEEFSSTEQKMINQIKSYKKRGSAMVTLPSKVRDFYFKNKEKIDALNEESKEKPKYKVGDKVTSKKHKIKDGVVRKVKETDRGYEYEIVWNDGNNVVQFSQDSLDEGTCGYGEDGKIGDKPAGPDLDEEIETSLTPNEIGDEAVERESASGAYESKTFDFKKMIKEALTPDYLKK